MGLHPDLDEARERFVSNPKLYLSVMACSKLPIGESVHLLRFFLHARWVERGVAKRNCPSEGAAVHCFIYYLDCVPRCKMSLDHLHTTSSRERARPVHILLVPSPV